MDMQAFVNALEAHTKALVLHAETLVKVGLSKVEVAVTNTAEKPAPKPRGRPAIGETPPPASPPAATAPKTAETPAPAPAANVGALDIKAVSAALVATAKVKGREFVVAILKKYAKGPKGTLDEIPAASYVDFVAELNGEIQEPAASNDMSDLLG